MTSRERVNRALRRQEPDRVPLGFSSNPGIHRRLADHFGLPEQDEEGLLRALGVDYRYVGAPYKGPRLHPEVPGCRVDPEFGRRTRWIEHSAGGYWDFCDFPLAEADADTIRNWPMPSPDDYDYDYDAVRAACRHDPDHALYLGGAGLVDILNSTGMLFGVEPMMLNLAAESEPMFQFIDRRLDLLLEVTRRCLQAAEGRIDFLWIGEDLGSQRGPLIGLEMFRRLLRPRHQRFIDLAQQYKIPVMIHSCGSSSWAFEDLIEMGISAVDTLQPEARDMAPACLKGRFGGRLAFHGCISTAGVVAHGTPAQVEQEVRQTLKIMMPGGGYCLAPTHALQDNSPVENVLTMYRVAQEYGRYDRH